MADEVFTLLRTVLAFGMERREVDRFVCCYLLFYLLHFVRIFVLIKRMEFYVPSCAQSQC